MYMCVTMPYRTECTAGTGGSMHTPYREEERHHCEERLEMWVEMMPVDEWVQ